MKSFICITPDTEKILTIKYFHEYGDVYLYLSDLSFSGGLKCFLERGRPVSLDKNEILAEVRDMFDIDEFTNFNEFKQWLDDLWKQYKSRSKTSKTEFLTKVSIVDAFMPTCPETHHQCESRG